MEKPQTNYLNLILISLCFVLFAVGVYYLGRQSMKPRLSSEEENRLIPTQVTPSNTPTISQDDKYVNKKFGFSFNYPKNYSINENSSSSYVEVMSPLDQVDRKSSAMQDNELRVEVYVDSKPENQDLNQYFTLELGRIKSDPAGIGGKVISTQDSTIDGIPAKSLTWQGNGTGKTYYLFYKNNVINIAQYPAVTSLQPDFDQILSTFKFNNNQQDIVCGGIMGKTCPSGSYCKLDGNYPDAGGTCVYRPD